MSANPLDPEILEALPTAYKQWAGAIPVDDLLKLSDAYGGTRLYFPMTFKPSHDIAQRLGEDLARRLIDLAKGDSISIPLCQRLRNVLRQRQAWAMKAEGKPLGEIAQALKTTDRTVMQLLRRQREGGASL